MVEQDMTTQGSHRRNGSFHRQAPTTPCNHGAGAPRRIFLLD